MTPWIALWFALSVLCDVSGQLCFKHGVDRLSQAPGAAVALAMALAMLRSGWVLAGIAIYAVEILVWLRILAEVPLSIAFPVASLNFLGVTLASALVLDERVTLRQWLGAGLITCGVVIVAHTA